jgi:hypothetical protein
MVSETTRAECDKSLGCNHAVIALSEIDVCFTGKACIQVLAQLFFQGHGCRIAEVRDWKPTNTPAASFDKIASNWPFFSFLSCINDQSEPLLDSP